jgi:hypothetical protein
MGGMEEAVASLFIPHRGSVRDSNEQSLWRKEPGHDLAPRFFASGDQELVSLPHQFFCSDVNVLHVEFEPSLWDRDVTRPGIPSETRLRGLGERPQGKMFNVFDLSGMQIPPSSLPMLNAGYARRSLCSHFGFERSGQSRPRTGP